MSILRYKHLIKLILLASFVTFLAVYFYMIPPESEKTPQTTIVTPPKKIIEVGTNVYISESYTLCKKIGLSCQTETLLTGDARQELANKTESELVTIYPTSAGWNLTWQGSHLYLEQTIPGLCPDHQKRWHLGLSSGGDKVTVYLGPAAVGIEGGIVKETDLQLATLPADIQERIVNRAIEFLDWEELIATLDSLEEYVEE